MGGGGIQPSVEGEACEVSHSLSDETAIRAPVTQRQKGHTLAFLEQGYLLIHSLKIKQVCILG